MQANSKIALVGNPNSGKSSLFNALTGLNQKVGNFPGVTVDKKTGICNIAEHRKAIIIDLPGTYSLYPKSEDERVTYEVLINNKNQDYPDLVVVIADASNLKRNLLFCSQIMDLKIPVVIALTMNDIARKKGISIDTNGLERMMGVPVVSINPRKSKGISELKKAIANVLNNFQQTSREDFISINQLTGNWLQEVKMITEAKSSYQALHISCNYMELSQLNAAQRIQMAAVLDQNNFQKAKIQAEEIMQRYQRIAQIMQQCVVEENPLKKMIISERVDKILLHPIWGNVFLLVVLFLLFQSIFWLAEYPMTWVEMGFSHLSDWLSNFLSDGFFKDLLIDGIIAGISGIAVFIPQIMILFGCITILEDSGYMARISFLTDRLMRSAGLNGKSVMPLISGMACAVPAIMAARTIQNKKERLITIFVTPLMSCSARLPVYTILIGLVVPSKTFGIFNLQGLVLMSLYLLGFLMALMVAKMMDFFMKKSQEKNYFLMELPVYRAPRWKNVFITMIEKAKIFVLDAGKVIMIISLLLWVLASFGPSASRQQIEKKYQEELALHPENEAAIRQEFQTQKLEHSFAGIAGKSIEPLIRPIGFDWKIGIALITSFAAREVFVGTMATLYSVDVETSDLTLREKMRQAKRPDGTPVYTTSTGLSLLIFYVFAMQCMSTMAIVKRETKSWKYPIIQFIVFFGLAYLGAWTTFYLFN